MGDVAVRNPATGELRMVPEEGAQAFTEQTGWHVATPEQREYGAKLLESGGVGQQALAAGETAIRTGTFGLVPGLAGGWQQRAEIQQEEHPYIAGAAQAAGAIAPALLTGGATGLVGGALGIGKAGLAAAGAVGEGLVGGLAEEIEQARAETRDVSAGNILLYGLGGELVGRALPKALSMGAGKVRRALSAVDEVAGEGLPSALAGAEARSVETEARLARDLPEGPERQAALDRTARLQYDTLAPQAAEDLDGILKAASDMGDTSASPKVVERLKQAMADEAPAQQNFFTEAKQRLDAARRKLREPTEAPNPAANSPINLEGKTLDKLNALPIEDAADHARVEALKENPEFAKTGRVTSNDGAHGITVVDDGGGALVLRDGRHRLVAAQELDRDTIWGRLVDGKTDRVIYQGEIPLKKLSPKGASLADAPGLGGFAKRVDQIIGTGLQRLDKTASAVDQFLISRDIKQQLQALSKKMGLVKSPQDAILHEEMRGVIDESWRALRDGLGDESLFGGAARIERDINAAWSDKILKGLGTTEGDLARKVDVDFKTGRTIYEADPSKVRNFLKSDRVDRTITARKLNEVLDGAEDMVRAHEVHGTWDPKKIAEQRARIARLRDTVRFSDEIQVAQQARKAAGAAPAAEGSASAGRSGLAEAADFVGENVAELFPYGGKLYRLGKRVLAMDKAGRLATRQTARRLAGVAGETAAGAAPKSGIRRAAEAVAGAAKEEAKAQSPALKRALEILERRRKQTGSVDIGARAPAPKAFTKQAAELAELMSNTKPTGAPWSSAADAGPRNLADALASKFMIGDEFQTVSAQLVKELSEKERGALQHWTRHDGYREIQSNLTGPTATSLRSALDLANAKGLVTPGEVTRGLYMTADELAALKASGEFVSPNFMATSASRTYPRRFLAKKVPEAQAGKLPVLLQVHQRSGVPLNFVPEEAEILLRPGTRFDVRVVREEVKKGVFEDVVHLFEKGAATEGAGAAAESAAAEVVAKAPPPKLGVWNVGRGESVNLNFGDDPIGKLREAGASDKVIAAVEARLRAAETPLVEAPIDPAVHKATATKNEELWTPAEREVVDDYQSEGYRDVGAFYREGATEYAESAKTMQKALDKAVKAGNVTPGTAWRGMDVTDKELDKFLQSATIKSKGVWSAATNVDRAQIFAPGEYGKKRLLFKIEQKTGVPVDASGEEELLLRHGTNFEIVKVGREKYVDGPYAKTPGDYAYIDTIELREIPAGTKPKGRAAERGIAEVGDGLRGILTGPLGITTGLGAVGLAAYPVVTALQRFTGEYSGPEESFEAKRKILDAEQVSPEALYEAIGASLEDLPKLNPELFQQLAARTAEKVRYCRANLPPGIQTTMMYPNGTPPSQSAMREFATMWNTVMDPHSVLEDIAAGTATGQQMKVFSESDPDLYEQLRTDVVSEIGANFRSVPLSTKLQLDILFNADGLAGPFFSSKAGDMIGQSLKDDQARGQPAGAAQDPEGFDQTTTGAAPGGLTAIQNSVTNRGGGA